MVEHASPWDSVQSSREMPIQQVRKSAIALANLLDENKDEQVLKEACLGLCQLFGEGIQNDRIQAILEANVVPKLVNLLRPTKSRTIPISVQSAALQVLGNVACGDDRQTQVVIDSGALPCLRSLLSSADRGIRKEVCWIVSNITESSHQVQDVLDADILPPLLKLLDNQDTACREDATWVLFNLSSNRDPNQIAYLAEKNGVRALCNLLACPKDLDVIWKGCGTVAAVALKGLRNILISGHSLSTSKRFNRMASLVAEAHGVERIEALTNHDAPDVRNRARLILERIFGTEPSNMDCNDNTARSSSCLSGMNHSLTSPQFQSQPGCSCASQQHQLRNHPHSHFQDNTLFGVNDHLSTDVASRSRYSGVVVDNRSPSHKPLHGDHLDVHGSACGSSTDSDPEDDDSDADLMPPAPLPCTCSICSDSSPLPERRARPKCTSADGEQTRQENLDIKPICEFCSCGGRLGDSRSGLASKLGRAVRLGHSHCLAVILSRMTYSQRIAAIETPTVLHPGGGPPDGGVGNSIPAVVLAAQLGKPECLSILLQKCRPDLDVTYGKKRLTALGWAALKGYVRCCRLLIENGAKTSVKCGDGVTALHLAASGGGHLAVCKLLIQQCAPVNVRSFKRQTPLCLAAQKGYFKVVQLLLEHGADVNNEDEGRYTPLHLASSKGFEHCVDILLKAGAKVDALTRKGVTPLHYAVQGGYAAVVRLLINAGANVNCAHKPLLLIAADDGNVEVVQALLDAQAAIDCRANIRAMLDKDTEVSDFLTPLHLAASKAHQDIVELLLSRGANVNEVTTKRGWSALDFAVLNGHAECAAKLLEHGSLVTDNCKSVGRNNWTLVQHAAHHGAKDVVRLLIQRIKEQRKGPSNFSVEANTGDSGAVSNDPADDCLGTEFNEASGSGNESFRINVDSSDCGSNFVGNHNFERASDNVEDNNSMHDFSLSNHHGDDDSNCIQPSHRYDPRSPDGDEVGFGTGPGYGNSSLTAELHTSKSRRRSVKEDRPSSARTREMRKREHEASEARDRLEEAMNQRSVSKLTEAIAHVSKLVLHLATSVNHEGNSTVQNESAEANTCNYQSRSGQVDPINGPSATKSCSGTSFNRGGELSSVHEDGSSVGPYSSEGGTSSLAMEIGLGNEVRKARKILASLLAEEKRIREEKEREVADSRRESAQVMVRKAIKAAKDGRDPRSLTRAIARATRNVLDHSEEVIIQATTIFDLISSLEKHYSSIKNALRERDLDTLCEVLPKAAELLSILQKKGGNGAAQRIFGGGDPNKVLIEGEKLKKELQAKREHAMMEERRAKDMELSAKVNLEAVMKSNDIVAVELATREASQALISKDSELGTTIEAAKKTLARCLKSERRKLKQARNSNDPEKIEETAQAVSNLGLQSLQADIDGAKEHAHILREQAAARRTLTEAISTSDITLLSETRKILTKLGMFTEAEKARAEIERLQKAKRARTLLENCIEDAKSRRDELRSVLSAACDGLNIIDCDNGLPQERPTTTKPENITLSKLLTWSWPDAQRLHELTERAKSHEQLCHSLCDISGKLLKELDQLGRKVLMVCTHCDDAQVIAATIAGYEKSFLSVPQCNFFDRSVGEAAVTAAKERLAVVQAMDQERVKAESAQMKVEYAIASSRRTAAVRNRNGASSSISASSSEGELRHVNGGVSVTSSPSNPNDDSSTGYSMIDGSVDHNNAPRCDVRINCRNRYLRHQFAQFNDTLKTSVNHSHASTNDNDAPNVAAIPTSSSDGNQHNELHSERFLLTRLKDKALARTFGNTFHHSRNSVEDPHRTEDPQSTTLKNYSDATHFKNSKATDVISGRSGNLTYDSSISTSTGSVSSHYSFRPNEPRQPNQNASAISHRSKSSRDSPISSSSKTANMVRTMAKELSVEKEVGDLSLLPASDVSNRSSSVVFRNRVPPTPFMVGSFSKTNTDIDGTESNSKEACSCADNSIPTCDRIQPYVLPANNRTVSVGHLQPLNERVPRFRRMDLSWDVKQECIPSIEVFPEYIPAHFSAARDEKSQESSIDPLTLPPEVSSPSSHSNHGSANTFGKCSEADFSDSKKILRPNPSHALPVSYCENSTPFGRHTNKGLVKFKVSGDVQGDGGNCHQPPSFSRPTELASAVANQRTNAHTNRENPSQLSITAIQSEEMRSPYHSAYAGNNAQNGLPRISHLSSAHLQARLSKEHHGQSGYVQMHVPPSRQTAGRIQPQVDQQTKHQHHQDGTVNRSRFGEDGSHAMEFRSFPSFSKMASSTVVSDVENPEPPGNTPITPTTQMSNLEHTLSKTAELRCARNYNQSLSAPETIPSNDSECLADLDLDFENENFGFDINKIIDDYPPTMPISDDDQELPTRGRTM